MLTWQMSFEYIRKVRESAADLLVLMSFCDRQAIPEGLLHDLKDSEHVDGTSGEEHVESFDDDVQMLEDLSFILTTAGTTMWDMHRLVQDAMQWWLLDHDSVENAKQRYVERLYTLMPTGILENWKTYLFALGYGHVPDGVLGNAGVCTRQGRWKEAEELQVRVLETTKRVLGEKHPHMLKSMENLALKYGRQGR